MITRDELIDELLSDLAACGVMAEVTCDVQHILRRANEKVRLARMEGFYEDYIRDIEFGKLNKEMETAYDDGHEAGYREAVKDYS